jgi:thioredoxin-like negative regulator of GroEL
VKLVEVDIDWAPRRWARFDVMTVPTLLLLRSGSAVGRRSGAAPATYANGWNRPLHVG